MRHYTEMCDCRIDYGSTENEYGVVVCEQCGGEVPHCRACGDTGTVEIRPAGAGHADDLAEYEWCECKMNRATASPDAPR
jgi:hypothetical protein